MSMRLLSRWTARRCVLQPTAVALVLVLLGACSDGAPQSPARAHPWLTAAPPSTDNMVMLAPFLVYRVEGERRAEAAAELEVQPYLQLSPGTARHFAGQELRVPAEMRPFLVRAVAAPDAAVSVQQLPLGLWMRSAASDAVQAQPLVVLLDPTPRDIFVTLD